MSITGWARALVSNQLQFYRNCCPLSSQALPVLYSLSKSQGEHWHYKECMWSCSSCSSLKCFINQVSNWILKSCQPHSPSLIFSTFLFSQLPEVVLPLGVPSLHICPPKLPAPSPLLKVWLLIGPKVKAAELRSCVKVWLVRVDIRTPQP